MLKDRFHLPGSRNGNGRLLTILPKIRSYSKASSKVYEIASCVLIQFLSRFHAESHAGTRRRPPEPLCQSHRRCWSSWSLRKGERLAGRDYVVRLPFLYASYSFYSRSRSFSLVGLPRTRMQQLCPGGSSRWFFILKSKSVAKLRLTRSWGATGCRLLPTSTNCHTSVAW